MAARDLYYAYNQFIVEEEAFGGSSFRSRFVDLFRVPRIRRATMGGAIVMTAQQFSGINIMVSSLFLLSTSMYCHSSENFVE